MHMILLVQCKCPRELVEIHNTVVLKGIFRRGAARRARELGGRTCWGRRRTNVISNSHPHFPSDLLDIADFATSVGGAGNIPGRWPRSTSCPSAEFGPSAPTTKSRSSRSASRSPSSLDRMGKFFSPKFTIWWLQWLCFHNLYSVICHLRIYAHLSILFVFHAIQPQCSCGKTTIIESLKYAVTGSCPRATSPARPSSTIPRA